MMVKIEHGGCTARVTVEGLSDAARDSFNKHLAAELYKSWKEGTNDIQRANPAEKPAV